MCFGSLVLAEEQTGEAIGSVAMTRRRGGRDRGRREREREVDRDGGGDLRRRLDQAREKPTNNQTTTQSEKKGRHQFGAESLTTTTTPDKPSRRREAGGSSRGDRGERVREGRDREATTGRRRPERSRSPRERDYGGGRERLRRERERTPERRRGRDQATRRDRGGRDRDRDRDRDRGREREREREDRPRRRERSRSRSRSRERSRRGERDRGRARTPPPREAVAAPVDQPPTREEELKKEFGNHGLRELRGVLRGHLLCETPRIGAALWSEYQEFLGRRGEGSGGGWSEASFGPWDLPDGHGWSRKAAPTGGEDEGKGREEAAQKVIKGCVEAMIPSSS